ncbi:MAG: ASKHA domain-containing protein [Bacteroidota bacterium]
MSYKIKLFNKGVTSDYTIEEGTNLLQFIRDNTEGFSAPCGGNGMCGKCKVEVKGEGHVTSCLYDVSRDIEVVMPGEQTMKILSTQYELTKTYWLNIGETAMLTSMPYGIAIDIGTTTMVFYIVNLVTSSVVEVISMINPQTKYGADVISRISYGAENQNGVVELQMALIDQINEVIDDYTRRAELLPEYFVKIAVVGNSTMLHQLMGIDAISIAHAPFNTVFKETKIVPSKELGVNINNEGQVVLSPSKSAYVGADIIAGLASLEREKIGKNLLFIDIGTNGEMVLVTPDRTISCATAAGPAFEGANISCGMGAIDGAVSKYTFDSYEVIGGGTQAKGVCGSGLIDIVGEMLKHEVMTSDGNIKEDFIIHENRKKIISLTQQDIREVQLAKSAIASGIKRMMAIAGISNKDLDNVLLAGGFGNYINIENAIKIGLLPDVPVEKYIQVGNTAGTGATLALKSVDFIKEMEELIDEMEYIELSTDEEFTTEFAMNMFF